MSLFVDIAFRRRIPPSNNGLFTFSVPEQLEKKCNQGSIVLAPLRGNLERAVIVRMHDKKPLFDTEEIVEVCTPQILDSWQFHLAQSIATKNFVPLARVLPLLLPKKIFDGNGLPPDKTIVKITPTQGDDHKPLGKVMARVMSILQTSPEKELHVLLREAKATRKTIDSLLEREMLSVEKETPSGERYDKKVSFPPLSPQQEKAYIALQKYSHTLLFAPTGSGKSHLLRMLAHEEMKKGKSVLLLVPEIGLTQELIQKCKTLFGEDVSDVYHSRLSEGEKANVFWRVKTGVTKLVIGSRTSLFLPFRDLGLIAIEEEHEWTLKSDQSPRYHARDVAEKLTEIHSAKCVFSSATPSLETYCSAVSSQHECRQSSTSVREVPYERISLPSRTPLSKITYVDLQEELLAKNSTLLSRLLQQKMKEVLSKNQQVLLFLNRRGFHRALICKDCSEVVRCPECGISLVLHAGNGRQHLLCHHCGRVYGVPKTCAFCQSTELGYMGSGTAKIEQMVKSIFPEKKVVRIDRDTTSSKTGFVDLYGDISSGDADILVGTQIIAKGLDFRNIGLVGVLDADAGLHIPDFRASEKTFQLLTQVIGRAGRRGQPSQVILQTRLPENPIFSFLHKNDTEGFLKYELHIRKQFSLPPFRRVIKLIFSGANRDTVFKKARETEKIIMSIVLQRFSKESVEVSVAPALHPKKYGKYFVNLLLTADNPEKILSATPVKGCRIDVDPIDCVK